MNFKDSTRRTGSGEPLGRRLGKLIAGFTLIELMITIGIVALLVALAAPGYQAFVRKANRGEAQQLLMNWANLQEIWRSNNPNYAEDLAAPNGIPLPTHDKYNFTLGTPDPPTATEYTLTATATGNQALDKQGGVTCTPMTLDQANTKDPPECW